MTPATSAMDTSLNAACGNGSFHPIPRPQKKDRLGIKRRREIKKKDREFQENILPSATCLVAGKSPCFGPLQKHHIVRRRNMDTRWDEKNAMILCWEHHLEIHMGQHRFLHKYEL